MQNLGGGEVGAVGKQGALLKMCKWRMPRSLEH